MASIDLPRALQDYFAFAETTPTRHGRRFSITLPYIRQDGRLDRLQWWYHLSPAKENLLGDSAAEALRAEAIVRFRIHIERWLQNTRQDLFGEGAIPLVTAEGNRILSTCQFNPSASDGMLQGSELDGEGEFNAGDTEFAAPAVDTKGSSHPAENDHSAESDPLPVTKTAFG